MLQANETKKAYETLQSELSRSKAGSLLDNASDIAGVTVIAEELSGVSVDQMREMIDGIKDQCPVCAVVLASVSDGKVTFIGGASKDAVAKGVHIGNVIRAVASVCGGGGGGKPDSAQAGGKNTEKTKDALAVVSATIKDQLA